MAAYRTAHRCLPSSYIPLLCIGTELIRAHNFNLARQYLRQVPYLPPFPIVPAWLTPGASRDETACAVWLWFWLALGRRVG